MKTIPSRADLALAIFADSELPADANEVVEKYVAGYRKHETLDTHRAHAVSILLANGYDVDVDTDTEWFGRTKKHYDRPARARPITDNSDLNVEVYEALALVLVYGRLQRHNDFLLKLWRETRERRAPTDGFECIPRMIVDGQRMAGEIHALGERIKARPVEPLVVDAKAKIAKDKKNARNRLDAIALKSKPINDALAIEIPKAIHDWPHDNDTEIAMTVHTRLKKLRADNPDAELPPLPTVGTIRKKIPAFRKTLRS